MPSERISTRALANVPRVEVNTPGKYELTLASPSPVSKGGLHSRKTTHVSESINAVSPSPRTSRRACKDLALARLLSTVDLDLSEDKLERFSKCSSTTTASAKRSIRSAQHNLESPVRRMHSLSISRTKTVEKKAPLRRPTSEYRKSRVVESESDIGGDSDYEMHSSATSASSDESSETTETEKSFQSDSSASDSSEEWTQKRPRTKKSKCNTPRNPPPRSEACSAMRVAKPLHNLLPKRTFSVPARKHTRPMVSSSTTVIGECLPGREQEFDSIYTFISGKLLQGTGGCMYISGLPGTGKTASVNAVLSAMTDVRDQHAAFQKITVNGMQVNDPKQVYVQILQQLTGQMLPAKQAAQQLEREFCSSGLKQSHREKDNLPPVVLVIDELDLLCTRRQDVLYNLFDWPTRPRGRRSLIVLAIANTMDLPERLLHPRVASRLGLTRLTFAPYSHEQLVHIVETRLVSNSFQEKALELAARKVAAVSGDVRRALDICRRAAEMVSQSKSNKEIGIEHINAALKEMFTTPKLCAIQACSVYEKLFLRALVAEFQARSTEEARLDRCIQQMCALCRLEGFPCPTTSEVFAICSSLGAHKLLLTEPSRRDTSMLVRLNCSKSDVLFALKPRASA